MSKFIYPRSKGFANHLGFTLVELLVVLVISLSVISISTVAYNKLSTNAYLKSASRHVAASLRYARSYAVSRGKEAHLKIDLVNRTYSYTGNSKVFKFKNNIDLEVYSAKTFNQSNNIAEIRFAPDGSSSGGRVKLSSSKKVYVIYVDWLTGQVGFDG